MESRSEDERVFLSDSYCTPNSIPSGMVVFPLPMLFLLASKVKQAEVLNLCNRDLMSSFMSWYVQKTDFNTYGHFNLG